LSHSNEGAALSSPATIIEVDVLEQPPESDAEGASSAVLPRAERQLVDHQEADVCERALAEAVTLAARAGRWDVVAQLAAYRRFR
jgi:hypothetical protein